MAGPHLTFLRPSSASLATPSPMFAVLGHTPQQQPPGHTIPGSAHTHTHVTGVLHPLARGVHSGLCCVQLPGCREGPCPFRGPLPQPCPPPPPQPPPLANGGPAVAAPWDDPRRCCLVNGHFRGCATRRPLPQHLSSVQCTLPHGGTGRSHCRWERCTSTQGNAK